MKAFRKYILIFILILLPWNLMSIDFGFHVFEVRATPNFSKGFFPTSVLYQFNFPIPDFIQGNSSVFAARFDNGLEYRTLMQHPDTGKFFDENFDVDWYFPDRTYTTHYDEFMLVFKQGFCGMTRSGEDHFGLTFSFGGRFEKAFERLSWMYDSDNLEGVFQKAPGIQRYPESSWIGQPELLGNRNLFQTFVNIGFDIDYLDSFATIKNGAALSATVRIAPEKMLLNDGICDFYLLDTDLSLAYTPYVLRQSSNDLTWFSVVLGNDFEYRYIYGSRIPYYAENKFIYQHQLPATEHVLSNRTYIKIYGPQIKVRDLYPSMTVFNDIGFSFGKALNSSSDTFYNELAGSFGFKAEFLVYNIFKLFYEVGFSYKRPFDSVAVNPVKGRFGITLEV